MHRLGCVSYLNAKPLIFGLESDPQINLQLDVPSRLLDGLLANRFDVALLPTIDYQRMKNLALLPVGGIGSEDETLTVRIFSKVPIEKIHTLAVDPDSHTSIALARNILEESFHVHPEFVPSGNADAQLLIGDKVITRMQNAECRMQKESQGYAFSPSPGTPGEGRGEGSSSFCIHHSAFDLDLGSAWRNLTNLPFLFACWTAKQNANLGDLPARLLAARQQGLANIETIIRRDALPRGWPLETARQYLTQNLCFDVGESQLQSVRLFHTLAARHGLISNPRPLSILPIN